MSTAAVRPPFNRRRTLAAIHAAASALGLDTAEKDPASPYRTIIRVQGAEGVTSAAQLSDAALQRVALYLRKQQGKSSGGLAGRIESLWAELGRQGLLRDPSDEGLKAFVLNRYKVASVRWLTAAQASHVIEALKAWAARGHQGE